MKDLILKIIRSICESEENKNKHPGGASEIEIQRRFQKGLQMYLDELENEGAITSYPNVNGIKIYSIKH